MLKKGQYIKILLLIEVEILIFDILNLKVLINIYNIIDFINYYIKINEFFNIILIQIHFIISKVQYIFFFILYYVRNELFEFNLI